MCAAIYSLWISSSFQICVIFYRRKSDRALSHETHDVPQQKGNCQASSVCRENSVYLPLPYRLSKTAIWACMHTCTASHAQTHWWRAVLFASLERKLPRRPSVVQLRGRESVAETLITSKICCSAMSFKSVLWFVPWQPCKDMSKICYSRRGVHHCTRHQEVFLSKLVVQITH